MTVIATIFILICVNPTAVVSQTHSPSKNESETQSVPREPSVDATKTPPKTDQQSALPSTRSRFVFEKKGAIVFRQIDDVEVKCDVYQPDSTEPMPAVVMIHGGGWRQGSKVSMLRHARRVARVGYVVVSINYRLAPRHPWPAQIDDCQYAIRWLRHNAAQYNVDPDRIGVFGYSAGGHLAALLGTTGSAQDKSWLQGLSKEEEHLNDVSPKVSAVAIGGAPCDFSWIAPQSTVLKYWMQGTREAMPEKYSQASPVEHITKDDAPFFIFHGTRDFLVPVKSSSGFHEALLEQEIPSTLLTVEGAGHLYTFSKTDILRQMIPFFDKHLRPSVPDTPED